MSSKSNTETRAALIRRRIPLCNYCNYYPATHYGGLCWIHCDPPAKREQVQQEKEARVISEEEAARVLAEQRKRDFEKMVAKSARKPEISFADVLKNKK
jgi:hypothetical protein